MVENVIQIKSGIMKNVDVSAKIQEKTQVHVLMKTVNIHSVIGHSVIAYDEVKEVTKTNPTNFNEKR